MFGTVFKAPQSTINSLRKIPSQQVTCSKSFRFSSNQAIWKSFQCLNNSSKSWSKNYRVRPT